MKLLWTKDLGYMPFDKNEFGSIVDNGDTVFLPFSSKENGNSILIKYIAVDKFTGQRIKNLSEKTEIVPVPKDNICREKHWTFGDKEVRCISDNRFIECWCDEQKLWKFTTWAWLSTEIIEKDGRIIFGTDGMGGRLYCLELETGKVISETKTQHSAFYDFAGFNWHNNNLVVYAKNKVAVVDPFTGEIADEYKISAKKYPYRSFLNVNNGYAYCCTVTNTNYYTIFCFEL